MSQEIVDGLSRPQEWRTGSQVDLNVYDEHDRPICQCHTPDMAQLIVKAVNWYRRRYEQGGL